MQLSKAMVLALCVLHVLPSVFATRQMNDTTATDTRKYREWKCNDIENAFEKLYSKYKFKKIKNVLDEMKVQTIISQVDTHTGNGTIGLRIQETARTWFGDHEEQSISLTVAALSGESHSLLRPELKKYYWKQMGNGVFVSRFTIGEYFLTLRSIARVCASKIQGKSDSEIARIEMVSDPNDSRRKQTEDLRKTKNSEFIADRNNEDECGVYRMESNFVENQVDPPICDTCEGDGLLYIPTWMETKWSWVGTIIPGDTVPCPDCHPEIPDY
jgi:hypothetical protein